MNKIACLKQGWIQMAVCACLTLAACSAPPPNPNESRAGNRLEARTFDFCLPQTETPPRLVSGKAPVYPVNRMLAGEDGYTTIEFDIGEDGTTSNFVQIESSHPKFYANARHAVSDWQFEPAISGTSPKAVRCRFRQEFSLKNKSNRQRMAPNKDQNK